VGQRRAGIATLELLMVLPMLVALVAAIFLLGRAAERKTSSATEARQRAWARRPQAPPGDVLQLLNDPLASEVKDQHVERVPPGPLFRGANFTAESRNHTIARTWDYRLVPFPAGQPGMQPHLDELRKALDNVPMLGGAVVLAVQVFGWTLNPERNVALVVIAALGPAQNIVVQIAGWTLKYLMSPIVEAARIVVEILKAIAEMSFQFGLARKLGRIANLMTLGLEAFDNLYEASRGRPGRWDPNMANRLLNAIP
jgi:hypothetical protein